MSYQSFVDLIGNYPLYVQMLAMLGLAMALSGILVGIGIGVLKATNRKLDNFTISMVVKRMRGPLFWFITAIFTTIFWGGINREGEGMAAYLQPAMLMARTLLYVFGALVLIRLIAVGADTVRHKFSADDGNNLKERKILTQLQYVQRVAVIIVGILAIALILLQFDGVRSLGTTVLASAGVTGIIVGLAAQKSIANLLAGFQIAFTQPIRMDDKLIVDGEFGVVEEITLTYVVLKLWDERRLIVPLQHFIDNVFQNWTHTSSQLVGTVMLYADYELPVDEIRRELERFLPTQEAWDGRVQAVQVTDLNATTMQVRILVSAVDSGATFNLRCAVREHMVAFVRKKYPQALPKNRLEMPGDFALRESDQPQLG